MKKVTELLSKIANEHAGALYEFGNSVSEKSLKKGSVFQEVTVPGGNAFTAIRAAAATTGIVIVDDEDNGVVAALLPGGFWNMSTVLLVARTHGDKAEIGCYSKEGLILQHAAKNTLEAFVEAL